MTRWPLMTFFSITSPVGRRRPIDGPWVGPGLADLVDATLWNAEIAQALHGAFEFLVCVKPHLSPRAHGDDEVGLR